MSSIFLVRHQAAGYVVEFPFASSPSAVQLAPVLAMLASRHGGAHKKTGEPFWHRVEEVPLVGPGEIPSVAVPEPSAGPAKASASADLAGLEMSGRGTVRNP